MFELPNLHLQVEILCFIDSCESVDEVLPRSRFILTSGSKKFSLLMEQRASSRFAVIVQSFSCSLCNHLNRFLGSKNCKYILRVCYGILRLPRIHTGLIWCEHFARGLPACEDVTFAEMFDKTSALAGSCNWMSDM